MIVTELEIYYAPDPNQSKLRAATYGRGIWETRIEFASHPMEFVASDCSQASVEYVKPNQKHEEILQIKILTNGDLTPLHMYSMLFDTYGCNDPAQDITGARLYYTGGVNAFSDEIELGYHPSPDGTFEFSFDQELVYGENYFWLAYDVSLYATLGNVIDGRFLSFNMGEEITPPVTDPFGARAIELIYCDAGATMVNSEYISRVIAGNVDQSSLKGPGGYQNFTDQVIEMQMNESIDVAVTNSIPHANNELLVWVDWNQDGEMVYPDEQYYISGPLGVSTYQFYITPPVNARLGTTRMRIRLHDSTFGSNWNPCGNSSLGEVEDYGVVILEESTAVFGGEEISYHVFPNPVKDELSITIKDVGRKSKVELLNIFGQVILKDYITDELVMDVSKISSGIYFLRVDDGMEPMVFKVVKE